MSGQVFDIDSPRAFYDELVVPQFNEFWQNNASRRKGMLAALVSYHFYEWVYGQKFDRADFLAQHPAEIQVADAFELIRRMVNATKHAKKGQFTSSAQAGFSNGFGDGFAKPLKLSLSQADEQPLEEILKLILQFWQQQASLGRF